MAIPTFEATKLQAICDVLGDTEHGLTGGEIGRVFAAVGIEDPLVGATEPSHLRGLGGPAAARSLWKQ